MSDRYASFANSGPGRALVKRLGLPTPPVLRRYHPGDPLVTGPVMLAGAPGGRLDGPVRKMLTIAGVALDGGPRWSALVFDATGIVDAAGLHPLYEFFHANARSLTAGGRVIVLGTPPAACSSPREATAQRALEGLTRSIGKEFGRGMTAQLVYVEPGAEEFTDSTMRFLLSGRSAYVSGQVIRIGQVSSSPLTDWDHPLEGKVALVTGAAQGIGAAIARVLARDCARVVVLDVPAAGEALARVANEIGGHALQLDLTRPDAPSTLAAQLLSRHGKVDIVVHNAGITRDKTIAKMSAEQWDAVIDVNLASQERINDALIPLLPEGGRIISVSSTSGIAGNRGQTNYATSKAGVIGLVQSMAPILAPQGVTINAVAPGFIETRMTARMPLAAREVGRRMNSMSQGGLPVDVAETIAWLAAPGSAGVTGNVVRVCGQMWLGA
ncbi:3-oxoacyl-[acyl-carrier protein] reductase [Asanoa hainanensis]|uniref:3-oxoacyl-[acyl-carrier protein] reductase n=1 Tax=Asanoa hainanensis TaxID=560556 RepID=A0A239MR90_9ACTN|nr:3-oxoacyl-ACP reductase [Asanoa hainanensis]SNT45251.1 3-oxoacyl-[acyl-carrier protein] reductase [Asanoa hainanensis]